MATLVTSLLHRLGGPLAVLAAMTVNPAQASLNWNWSYSGDGITADGRFITDDTPDALGFYTKWNSDYRLATHGNANTGKRTVCRRQSRRSRRTAVDA